MLQQLFLAVFLHVGFGSFFGVISSVKRVAPGGVCMMPRFFVPPAFVMFGCFDRDDARHAYDVPRPCYGARLLFLEHKITVLCLQTQGRIRLCAIEIPFANGLRDICEVVPAWRAVRLIGMGKIAHGI